MTVVFGFGSNCFGQCGVDRKWTKLSSLTQVEGLQQNINQVSVEADALQLSPLLLPIKVCCGLDHSLFLDKDHNVTACGWSADGQTGEHTAKTSLLHNNKNSILYSRVVAQSRVMGCSTVNMFFVCAGTGCYDNVSMPTHVVGALGSCNAVQLFSGADTCFATTGTVCISAQK